MMGVSVSEVSESSESNESEIVASGLRVGGHPIANGACARVFEK